MPLDGWETLGGPQRRIVADILTQLYHGKGALFRTCYAIRSRGICNARLDSLFASLESTRGVELSALENLRGRLEVDGDRLPDRGSKPLEAFLDSMSGEANREESLERDLCIRAVVFAQIAAGVLAPTALSLIETLLERSQRLEECRDLLGSMRQLDTEAADDLRAWRNGLAERVPEMAGEVAERLEATLAPAMELVRAVRADHDDLRAGLIPHEFLARATERFASYAAPAADQ